MLTAAVRDLHLCYPNQFLTDVRTSCPELWENNPYITTLDEKDPDVQLWYYEALADSYDDKVPRALSDEFKCFVAEMRSLSFTRSSAAS